MQQARTGYDQADDKARELVHRTKQVTRRRFTPEEKVRIVIEGIRGEIPISVLCRREGIRSNVYYKWLNDFMEAGKARLKGDTLREASRAEVEALKREADRLKELVANLSVENLVLKKPWLRPLGEPYVRKDARVKAEVLKLVEHSPLPVRQTLMELEVPPATYYRWRRRYTEKGLEGLRDLPPRARRVWNRLPEEERGFIVGYALEHPSLSPREVSDRLVDRERRFGFGVDGVQDTEAGRPAEAHRGTGLPCGEVRRNWQQPAEIVLDRLDI